MQEQSIFIEALEKENPDERADFLNRVCAHDAVLRQRIEKLLKRHQQNDSLLDAVVSEAVVGVGMLDREGPGSVLGPYKLVEQIGEGGFGLVYLAEQLHPVQRHVAVKILKPGMDTRQVIARFEAERQALALMDHPNIARVFDAGETASGRPHFVMELVRGEPVTEYCEKNGLAVEERLALFVSICSAVQHAHQKGIIHRDIKPSNVLVTQHDGKPVVKVIDFGIAKAIGRQLTDKTVFTGAAQMIGTPLYMSPEQAQMNGLDVDTRSDVYSLGVLLYEMLTGTTPFDKERLCRADYVEMRRIIREEDPPRPSTRLSTLKASATAVAPQRGSGPRQLGRRFRGELDWIVMKALEKDRTRRYETAGALAEDVQHYLNNEPVDAHPPSAWYRFGKVARRHKGTLVAAALVLLALVAGTVVSAWQAFRATEAMNAEKQALIELGRELERTQEAREEATRELFDALVAEARANRLSRRIGQRFGTLELLRRATTIAHQLKLPPERFLELRNEAIAALALPDLRVAQDWPTPAGSWAVFDPGLKHYARTDRKGTVHVRRTGDGTETYRLPGHGPGELGLEFSPDGRYLAVQDPYRTRIHVWQLEGAAPTRVLDQPAIGWNARFSPDSRQLALQQKDGAIGIFDLATATRVRQITEVPPVLFMAYHPDGGQLALSCNGTVQVREIASGKTLWQRSITRNSVNNCIQWQPDGKTLALLDGEVLDFWDVAADKQVGQLRGNQDGGTNFNFNPSGTVLATRQWSGIVRLWDAQNCRLLFSTQAEAEAVQFSPDGRFLAGTTKRDHLRIWEVADGREYRTLTGNPLQGNKTFAKVVVNASGNLVAAGGASGQAFLWDLSRGKEVLTLSDVPGWNLVAFETAQPRSDGAAKNEDALLTLAGDALFRRSISAHEATGAVQVGSPHRLPIPVKTGNFVLSLDGKVMAFPQIGGNAVRHADQPERVIKLGPHVDARGLAVSPNGAWVVTGRWSHPGGLKVWHARTGKLEKDLPAVDHCWTVFSPDGRRMLTSAPSALANYRIISRWEVGTWVELPFAKPLEGSNPVFSPDGKTVALETGTGAACLIDAETGQEFARLEDPNQDRTMQYVFTPDGTKLLCATEDGCGVHVWDLQAIRRQLAEMKLDW